MRGELRVPCAAFRAPAAFAAITNVEERDALTQLSSKLNEAARAVSSDPSAAVEAIRSVARETLRTAEEAEAVVQLLRLWPLPPGVDTGQVVGSPLHDLVAWMQGVEGAEAAAVFKRFGAPELVRIVDDLIAQVEGAKEGEDTFRLTSDLMFALKVVCMYAPEGGLERLHRAARSPHLHDEYLWSIVFAIAAGEGHPWQAGIVDALRDPIPRGFAGIAYLDLANDLARQGQVDRHPFDSEAGFALLKGWLEEREGGEVSYAHSATASIPFLSEARRDELLRLAEAHSSRNVQLEAAWAAARVGEVRGLETLQQACVDPRHALRALRYLHELGATDRIPVHTRSPDFGAMAQMCDWLAHPQEFGRPPDEITQADTRELHWPPTNDRRQVWLFRYEYPPTEEGDAPEIGYGMVGSVTFALFGEATADKTPEEVYALHCAWELSINQDPRAPAERTIAAGTAILAEANPGFGPA